MVETREEQDEALLCRTEIIMLWQSSLTENVASSTHHAILDFNAFRLRQRSKRTICTSTVLTPNTTHIAHSISLSGKQYLCTARWCWPHIVLEPDPRKIEKEGLVNAAGWKCTLQNVRIIIGKPSAASRSFLRKQTLAEVFKSYPFGFIAFWNEAKRKDGSRAVSISNKRTSEC